MVRDVFSIAEKEQELNDVDRQPVNQDTTVTEVVDADDGLSWGAVSDDGNGIVEVCGNDTDIDIE